jgi:hypothetical protein
MTKHLYLVFRLAALAAVELFAGLGPTAAAGALGGFVVDRLFALRTREA